MSEDLINIQCPECKETFIFYTTLGPGEDIDFSLHDAPLICLSELNDEAKEGRVQCIHCKTYLKVPIRYCVYVTKATKMGPKILWRRS